MSVPLLRKHRPAYVLSTARPDIDPDGWSARQPEHCEFRVQSLCPPARECHPGK
jgi:hypothetical protein